MTRESILQKSGLPQEFGVVLLVLALIFALAPYLSGTDFGIFKIPPFSARARRRLKIIGPPLFTVLVVLFVPLLEADPLRPPRHVRKVLKAIGEFSDFQSNAANIEEADRILRSVGLKGISMAADSTSATADIEGAWSVTIWPKSYEKPNVYGLRYSNRDPQWDWERTYFELVIEKRSEQ